MQIYLQREVLLMVPWLQRVAPTDSSGACELPALRGFCSADFTLSPLQIRHTKSNRAYSTLYQSLFSLSFPTGVWFE